MEKADNEMYALVDEEFLAKFSNQHLNYMKKTLLLILCWLLQKNQTKAINF